MDIFEYNEVRWPTRALQQEEEEQAFRTAHCILECPSIHWEPGVQQPQNVQLLVVAMNPASCALVECCLGDSKPIGRIVPASSSQGQAADEEGDALRAAAAEAGGGAPAPLYAADVSQHTLVCCCPTPVKSEQAPAWARGILQQLKPHQLLLIGSMQIDHYRGDADPSQELLAFLLQTTVAREAAAGAAASTTAAKQQQQHVVPFLPSGSIVSGLPAALITQAELAGLPADLVVVLDMLPALVLETLPEVAAVLHGALSRSSGSIQGLKRLREDGVIQAARSKLQQTTCRPTSVYS